MLERLELIFGKENLKSINDKRILLVGVGGVGGACFEALVRSGFNNITVIDNDCFDKTNLNRQLLSNINNIGSKKVLEAVLRVKSINPDILVETKEMFLNEANINEIDIYSYDYVIDACDTVSTKVLLIKKCIENNVKIISSMGTGNRVDPTKLIITDIWKTSYDPLAKAVRKMLREANVTKRVNVLTSLEQPVKSGRIVGSTCFVPNAAGFCIASYVFNDIIKNGM